MAFITPASPSKPGFTAVRESHEAAISWQSHNMEFPLYAVNPLIDSTAVDSGNTVTTTLRPGLVMAQLDSGAGWVDYDPDATDGSQQAAGVLVQEVNLYDYTTGAAIDKLIGGTVVIGGRVKAGNCINLDRQARNQLRQAGFVFDDEPGMPPVVRFRRTVNKTADYTVVAADHGVMFTTLGAGAAVNFTLPTLAVGLAYEFLNAADQNMTITSAAGNDIITFNDLAASTVAFSTSSQKIGGRVRVESVYVNTTLKWVVTILSTNTVTIT